MFQQRVTVRVQFTEAFYLPVIHGSVAVNTQPFQPLQLDVPGSADPRPDLGGCLSPLPYLQILILHPGYIDLQIDPVSQRAGYLPLIPLDFKGAAGTFSGFIS